MLTYPSPTIQSHHGSDEPARADSHRVDHNQWVTGATAAWKMADPPTKRSKRSLSPIPQRPACRSNAHMYSAPGSRASASTEIDQIGRAAWRERVWQYV